MLKVLVLICSSSLDHSACTPETAIDIVRMMRVSSPQQCAFMGQAMLAPTALTPDPEKQYVKIMCVPEAVQTRSPRPPSNKLGGRLDSKVRNGEGGRLKEPALHAGLLLDVVEPGLIDAGQRRLAASFSLPSARA